MQIIIQHLKVHFLKDSKISQATDVEHFRGHRLGFFKNISKAVGLEFQKISKAFDVIFSEHFQDYRVKFLGEFPWPTKKRFPKNFQGQSRRFFINISKTMMCIFQDNSLVYQAGLLKKFSTPIDVDIFYKNFQKVNFFGEQMQIFNKICKTLQ